LTLKKLLSVRDAGQNNVNYISKKRKNQKFAAKVQKLLITNTLLHFKLYNEQLHSNDVATANKFS
jgi:hypothetical protein